MKPGDVSFVVPVEKFKKNGIVGRPDYAGLS